MKFLVSVLLIGTVSFVAGLFLPWWSVAVVAFVVIAFLPQKPLYAFLSGFAAIFILWCSMALVISSKNDDILVHKIAMIILKVNSPIALILVTGFIGALIAGCAALAGSFLRKPEPAI